MVRFEGERENKSIKTILDNNVQMIATKVLLHTVLINVMGAYPSRIQNLKAKTLPASKCIKPNFTHRA